MPEREQMIIKKIINMKPDFFDEIELDAVADNTEDVLDSIYNIAFVFVFNGKNKEKK